MTKRAWWWIGIIAALILSASFIWINRFQINDWYVLRSYQPPADVEQLAVNSSMSDYGRQLFYVGKPKITGGEEFNEKCRDYEETKVLGCIVQGQNVGVSLFAGNGYEIYILNVTETDLAGIQEVTAAHEMLHAAYERLSTSERRVIDAEIVRVYESIKNDKLQEVVSSYAAKDPSVVTNELHSLLGTEVINIGSSLEQYYSRYFDDRSKVVALFQEYESVFDKAKNDAETIYGSIKLLESQILSQRADLDASASVLEARRAELDAYRDNGQTALYNSLVPQYNRLVNDYNNKVANIRALFEQYNSLVAQYDDLVVKQKQLVDAIDSNIIPEAKL